MLLLPRLPDGLLVRCRPCDVPCGWPGSALLAVLLIGVPLLFVGGGDSTIVDQTPATAPATTVAPPTTQPAPATVSTADAADPVTQGQWSSVLATTVAGTAPPAAVCPPGTNPNTPGPIDQARPGEGPWSNQAAVFDSRAGRIVFIDEDGETWTFDVCANIWQEMDPTFVPDYAHLGESQLVYDIDSDRTIAFGPRNVYAYDAATNTWTRRGSPVGRALKDAWLGSVYDPISGLVLVQFDDGMLAAYDVDTDTWTEIGVVSEPREITSEGQTTTSGPPFLVGYVSETDRLAFLAFNDAPFQGSGELVDPRTGESTGLADPPTGVRGGFGSFQYTTGGDTAYPSTEQGVCRLDPTTLDWDCGGGSPLPPGVSAMVYDPINARIVVINNSCCAWPGNSVSDNVLAIDVDTGERTELLATANTRIETDGS